MCVYIFFFAGDVDVHVSYSVVFEYASQHLGLKRRPKVIQVCAGLASKSYHSLF